MSLFFDYSRPGPGVDPDAPRKTGLPRIWEMISRDYTKFWLAGLINLLFLFPFVFGAGYAYATHSLLFAMLTGGIGGSVAAPSFYGLADTLLRSLRDEPGFWWYRYSQALKKNWKGTLLPGAFMGAVFSVQCFTLLHMPALGSGLGLFFCQIISLIVSLGFFLWALPQQVLLELGTVALVKNSFLLFFRYIWKTVSASVICLLFLLFISLLFPGSVFLLFVVGLWLPMLCVFQIIYPTLDDVFGIEETLERQNEVEIEREHEESEV